MFFYRNFHGGMSSKIVEIDDDNFDARARARSQDSANIEFIYIEHVTLFTPMVPSVKSLC